MHIHPARQPAGRAAAGPGPGLAPGWRRALARAMAQLERARPHGGSMTAELDADAFRAVQTVLWLVDQELPGAEDE